MIPNILHYVHLSEGGRPWRLHHYLSVLSASKRSGVEKIYIWVDKEPEGVWWERTKNLLEVIFVEPPSNIFGIPITQQAHKSDVIRLQVLLEYGGIYVDTDTIFVKNFEPLLDSKFVLGQQNINGSEGLCPAVILSEKDAMFARYWLGGFKETFKGGPPGSDTWCTHSVHLPYYLSKKFPDDITVLDHLAFFWPLYHSDHMKMMFEEDQIFNKAFSHHLWESSGKNYLDKLSIDIIKSTKTTFTRLVRDLL